MATKKEEEKLVAPLAGVSENTAQKLAMYQAGYQQGENVTNAYNEYNQLKQNAPQAYVSPYQTQLDDLYAKITNRGPFKYSLNGDMLYQNAKEQYQQLGKQAMVDTIGQATQLTGGYGNSYAQNAGNQMYQQWLTKLNDKIPEFYDLAMRRYAMEGDELNNQYGLLRDRENEAYGRYRDTVSDYNQNLQMAYNVYNNERDDDYGKYRDALDYWMNQAGAENKDYWTQTQFDYQKEQDALDREFRERQLEQEMAYKYAALARSGGGGGGGTKKEPEKVSDNPTVQALYDTFNTSKALVHPGGMNGNVAKYTANTVELPGLLPAIANAVSLASGGANAISDWKEDIHDWDIKNLGPKLDLGGVGGPNADLADMEAKADKLQSKYTNEDDFLNDLVDTLEWYEFHGNLSKSQVETIMRHYGLI